MGWLDSVFGWGGEDPRAVQQRMEGERRKQAAAAAAAEAARIANQTAAQQAVAAAPPAYSGPTAQAKLEALLPPGFEQSVLPGSFADPYIEQSLGAGRGTAEDLIARMLRRQTTTPTGASSSRALLASQEPGVREKLRNIANLQLESERAKLRGIAGEGAAATAGQSGEFYDPTPYKSRVDTDVAQFQQAFPASYTKSVGEAGPLFDLAALQETGGGVTSPQNISLDPYATEGGKLKTGLEEEGAPAGAKKKRTTAVF